MAVVMATIAMRLATAKTTMTTTTMGQPTMTTSFGLTAMTAAILATTAAAATVATTIGMRLTTVRLSPVQPPLPPQFLSPLEEALRPRRP
eukprot:1090289-Pyramimonas_sp.AAC.1